MKMAKKSVGISILTLKMIIELKYKRLISPIQPEIKGIEQGGTPSITHTIFWKK